MGGKTEVSVSRMEVPKRTRKKPRSRGGTDHPEIWVSCCARIAIGSRGIGIWLIWWLGCWPLGESPPGKSISRRREPLLESQAFSFLHLYGT